MNSTEKRRSQTINQSKLPPIIRKSLRECIVAAQNQQLKTSSKKLKPKAHTQQTEQQLVLQIQALDQVLANGMVFIDGMLFSQVVDQRLIQAIVQELRRSKGPFDKECFGTVLQEQDKNQLERQQPSSVYRRIRDLGKLNQHEYFTRMSTADASVSPTKKLNISIVDTNLFNEWELNKFIKKQEKVISIWLPPASYPQFFGIVFTGKKRFSQMLSGEVLRIEKMYMPRYHDPTKLFPRLLSFVKKQLSIDIKVLEFITTKDQYNNGYRKWGWQLRAIKEGRFILRFS